MPDLHTLSATELCAAYASGQLSPVQATQAVIEQIARQEPRLNALYAYDPEAALAQARASEARWLAGTPLSPLDGVPGTLKENLATRGCPMPGGSAATELVPMPDDSPPAARWREAGLVLLAKTTMPDYGMLSSGLSSFHALARNPWDISKNPGGSSAGAGAAAAAGYGPLHVGTDIGGSVRLPAGWCGLVGLKPTRGRNPLGPDYGDMGAGLICEHVVTHTVLDSAAILDVTAGPDLGAPYYPPPPARPFAAEVGAPPGRLRIAFSTVPLTGTPVHPECKQAAHHAARQCEALGHHVEEATPQVSAERFNEIFTTIWLGMVGWAIRDWARRTGREPTPDQFEAHTWKMYSYDAQRRPSDLFLAIQDMQRIARELAPFFTRYDIWLTPTATQPPQPLGWFDFDPAHPKQATERMGDIPRFTAIANMSGQPAISLPLHWTPEGLPVGVQLIGRYGDEATLFRLAAQLEQASPWRGRVPLVS